MNEMEGIVERLDGGFALIRAAGPGPACGACARKEGCASAGVGNLLDKPLGKERKPGLLRLPNTISARPGDSVMIRAADGLVLKAVWRAYGIPLALGLLGALLASFFGTDGAALAGLLAGLAAGFLLMRGTRLEAGAMEPILSISFKQTSVISVKGQETC